MNGSSTGLYTRKKVFAQTCGVRYNTAMDTEADMAGNMDFKEEKLIEFLKSKAEIWLFPRLLEEVYADLDTARRVLTDKLTEYETDGGENREQISRKVRNWLNGKNQPSNREEMFKICFALRLNLEQADRIFSTAEECGIHYRNPRELIYAFCLKKGYDYPKAQEIVRDLGQAAIPKNTMGYHGMMRKTSESEASSFMTVSIKNEFINIEKTEDLKAFIERNQTAFGIHHNTAYRKFKMMLDYLLEGMSENNKYTDAPGEKRYSIEKVTEEYLRMGLPYQKKSRQYSKAEKAIKRHWPSPRMVQEMYSRKRDVNRKTLLLLYLATEGMGAEVREKSFVAEHCQRMDMMMASCGMPCLNLHNPFDYLVVQSLHLADEDDFMSWKMERILKKVFHEPYRPAYIALSCTNE